jgi:hypothetical protein
MHHDGIALNFHRNEVRHFGVMLTEQRAGDAELLADLTNGRGSSRWTRAEVIERLAMVERLAEAVGR